MITLQAAFKLKKLQKVLLLHPLQKQLVLALRLEVQQRQEVLPKVGSPVPHWKLYWQQDQLLQRLFIVVLP